MNLLAHLHLAEPHEGLMLGGVVADFASAAEIAALSADVQAGVRLHQLIDGFTDRHPLVHASIGRVSARLGWFSGIVIDIYYDHLLTRHWDKYSAIPLSDFARSAYQALDRLFPAAPPDAQAFIRRFIDRDFIREYSTVQGITTTLERVSRRIAERIPKRAIWLPDAMSDLIAADAGLESDFLKFYPKLLAFARETSAGMRQQAG